MPYAIIIENKVAQLSDTPIEVAAPIVCVQIPAGKEVKENYIYSVDDKGNAVYAAPTAPVIAAPSLKDQAQAALAQARTTVYNNYGILNKPTPDNWE